MDIVVQSLTRIRFFAIPWWLRGLQPGKLPCGAGADSQESPRQQGDQTSQFERKSILNIHWKDWCWSWSSNTLATWCEEPTDIRKDLDAGKDWEQKRVTEDEMVGWHHWLSGMSLSKLWEIVKDREACCGAVHGVTIDWVAPLPFTVSQSLFKLTSIELVMLSNHLTFCRPFLLLPSIFPSFKVFSNESALQYALV